MTCECGAQKTFKARPGDNTHSTWCPDSKVGSSGLVVKCHTHPNSNAVFQTVRKYDNVIGNWCLVCCSKETADLINEGGVPMFTSAKPI